MLSKEVINSALAISEKLGVKGKIIRPKYNSLLSEVCIATTQPYVEPGYQRTDLAQAFSALQEEGSTQDAEQQRIAKLLADTISNSIAMFQNVVMTEVDEYANKLRETLDRYEKPNAIDLFDLQVKDVPLPISSNEELIDLNFYKGKPLPKFDAINRRLVGGDTDIRSASVTGNEMTDGNIELWLNEVTPEVRMLWSSIYRSGSGSNMLDAALSRADVFERLNISLAIYLTAVNKMETPDEGVVGMDLTEYRAYLTNLRNYAGAAISKALNLIKNLHKLDKMVIRSDVASKTIAVYKPMYDKFLNGGGTVEAVLGRCIRNDNVTRTAGMIDNVIEYTKAWSTFSAMVDKARSNEILSYFKASAKAIFRHSIKDGLTDVEFAYYNGIEPKRPIEIAENLIDEARIVDFGDLDRFAMKVVTKSRFYFTSANEYLTYMDEVAKANPGIDASGASLIATIEHLTNFLAENVEMVDYSSMN